uniref:Nuclear autoantigenic sperm protein n=1 Tax=Nomascus leucogenys TaxID=61853 RepID=A0A2I3GI90_NOMLE
MATESTATAAVAAELVSADKIEDVPAPSTSTDKVERDEVSSCCPGWGSSHLLTSAT